MLFLRNGNFHFIKECKILKSAHEQKSGFKVNSIVCFQKIAEIMQPFLWNQGKFPSWKREITAPVLSWNSMFLVTSYPNITSVRTATKTSYFLSSTQRGSSLTYSLIFSAQLVTSADCADPPAQRGFIMEWMWGLDAELKSEMERAGQDDSGCEHWAEEKKIKRGCRMKIEAGKRKNQKHKEELGRHCRKKYQWKNRLRTSPNQKQTNEITPDDQVDLRGFQAPPQEMELYARKNTKKQWQCICRDQRRRVFCLRL